MAKKPERKAPGPRLMPDKEAFDTGQRRALSAIVNGLLNLQSDLQETLDLLPEICQIYMIIAISGSQRYTRTALPGAFDGDAPLPQEMIGSVSRRRIADITGIPRETVARHVRALIERGFVVETGVGKLITPPGLLRDIGPTGLPDRLLSEFASTAQKRVKLGVLKIETRADGAVT